MNGSPSVGVAVSVGVGVRVGVAVADGGGRQDPSPLGLATLNREVPLFVN
jgi:hypothetical protein